MERTRSSPRPAEDDAAPPLEAPLPLRALLEEVRAPGAARADVDALLRGLAGPLEAGESARERADVLLDILHDAQLSELTGSDSRPVRGAALEALLALGYPYALEVPPEVLSQLRPDMDVPDVLRQRGFQVGLALPVLVALGEFIFAALEFPASRGPGLGLFLFIAGTTLVPALLAFLGAWWRSRSINLFGVWPLALMGFAWLLPALFVLVNSAVALALVFFLLSAAHLASALLLSMPKDGA